jgi:hypothetical protein
LKSQWSTYTTALSKTTCKAEQRRLLARGPPINISDPKALECPDGGEVHSLWYMVDGKEYSAKLEGSYVGEVSIMTPHVTSECKVLQLQSLIIAHWIKRKYVRRDKNIGMSRRLFISLMSLMRRAKKRKSMRHRPRFLAMMKKKMVNFND